MDPILPKIRRSFSLIEKINKSNSYMTINNSDPNLFIQYKQNMPLKKSHDHHSLGKMPTLHSYNWSRLTDLLRSKYKYQQNLKIQKKNLITKVKIMHISKDS